MEMYLRFAALRIFPFLALYCGKFTISQIIFLHRISVVS
jgi:hypothetical protein